MRLSAIASLLPLIVGLNVAPAAASSPAAAAQGNVDAKAACRKASDLKYAATVGAPIMFSDSNGKTAILVTGIWRPAHMKNARATMLCLYDRASRTVETSEAKGWAAAEKPKG